MAGDTPDRRGNTERRGGAERREAAGRGGDAGRQRTGGRRGAGGAGATARPRAGANGTTPGDDGTGEPPVRGTMSEAQRYTPRGRSVRDASVDANGRGDPFRPALEVLQGGRSEQPRRTDPQRRGPQRTLPRNAAPPPKPPPTTPPPP